MKKIILLIGIVFATATVLAQVKLAEYGRYDSIYVLHRGDTMANPWAGGLNAPQFTTLDINRDSMPDLYVFDRDNPNGRVFINTGKLGRQAFRHASDYEPRFPRQWGYSLMVDYNLDGQSDIFTSWINGDIRLLHIPPDRIGCGKNSARTPG